MRNAPGSEKAPVGVFVGLATLDVIHRIAAPPAVNREDHLERAIRLPPADLPRTRPSPSPHSAGRRRS